MKRSDVVVLGAGAAGLTAAIFAAQAGLKVTVLERTDKPGKKILMSGGTRCNVLPVTMTLDDYFSDSSVNLLKRIFNSWSVDDCKAWFEQDLGLPLACETESNKWFPVSNSARDVRDALLHRALKQGVQIHYNMPVTGVLREGEVQQRVDSTNDSAPILSSEPGNWLLQDENGRTIHKARRVILATGGLSVPTIGTDGMGHRILSGLNLPLRPTYPALTPLTGPHPGRQNLAGVSLRVAVTARAGKTTLQSNREGFLFTHKGYSGPAVLDVSHMVTRYINSTQNRSEDQPVMQRPVITVNWTAEDPQVWKLRLQTGRATVRNSLHEHLPERLVDALLENLDCAEQKVSEISRANRQELMRRLTEYELPWASHEGYKKAEVTGGGLPLKQIDTATMQVKAAPGLFVCGEIIDVFGRIGGFNFYWAWVTGRLAGLSASAT
jgi:predicted Rossmann fold flavoprotein